MSEPSVWHAPAAYWFWHRLPTEPEIVDQVAQLSAAGWVCCPGTLVELGVLRRHDLIDLDG